MTIQLSTRVRNAKLDAMETTIGTAPLLRIYSGSMPATPATAPSGTLLAEMTLPSDWMAAAAAGAKAMAGTWQDGSANAAGTAGYYRIYDSPGTNCDLQGTVTATGGGGDLTLNNVVLAAGQQVSVTSYTWTDNNG